MKDCITSKERCFSSFGEKCLLHLVCLSFMFTTFDFFVLFWSLRVIILCCTFFYFSFNLASCGYIVQKGCIFLFSLFCCILSLYSIHFLLIISTLILLPRVPFRYFVDVNLFYFIITVLLLLPLSRIGLIQNYTFIIKTGEMRDFYCFTNPNRFGSFLYAFVVFLSLFFTVKRKLLISYCIVFGSSFFIYFRTGCRTAFIALIFQFVVFLVFRVFFVRRKHCYKLLHFFMIPEHFFRFILSLSGILLIIFSFALSLYFSTGIMLFVDLLIGRGVYLYEVVKSYSFINLFLGYRLNAELPLDNSYIYILCTTNIFVYIIFSIFIYRSFKNCSAQFFVCYAPFIAAFLVYGITESLLGYYSYIALVFYFMLLKSMRGEL